MREQRDSHDVVGRRLAVFLIVIGVIFAVDSILKLSVAWKLWPLLLTIVAVGLIGIFVKRGGRSGGYLACGVYLLCFSGLAIYFNFTSWAMLSILWPAYIAFLGLAFMALFLDGGNRWTLLLALLLVSTALMFWLFLAFSAQLWWVAFILAGASLMVWEAIK